MGAFYHRVDKKKKRASHSHTHTHNENECARLKPEINKRFFKLSVALPYLLTTQAGYIKYTVIVLNWKSIFTGL